MRKCILLILFYLGVVASVFSASSKKYINVNFGDGQRASLWCDEDSEEGLYSFSYGGYDWKCKANGIIVYCRDGDSELWFDEKGNNYYSKISDHEMWNEFDWKGNIIHSTTNTGDEFWYEYSDNKLIHSFDTFGFETFYEYDSKGRRSYMKFVSPRSWSEYRYEYNVTLADGEPKTELPVKTKFSSSAVYDYLMNQTRGYKVAIINSDGEEYYEEYTSEGILNRRYSDSYDIFYCEDGSILNRTEIDSEGNEKIYDGNGQLVIQRERIDLGSYGVAYNVRKFEYYPTGNIKKITLRNGSDDYIDEYDTYGNLVHSYCVYVGSGKISDAREEFYEYNSENLLTYKKELIYDRIYEYWYDSTGKVIKNKTSKR